METKFQNQLQRVYQSFFDQPQTMKEVDVSTGIMRENVCRHCKVLRESNRLAPVKKRRCTITGYPYVTEWTSNPDLMPPDLQLSLFDNWE